MMYCKDCLRDLDLEASPDIGECPVCGGKLAELDDPAEEINISQELIDNTMKSIKALNTRPKRQK